METHNADLNKYLDKQDKGAIAREDFLQEIYPYLSVINEAGEAIRKIEAKYPEYDFEDIIKEEIEGVL